MQIRSCVQLGFQDKQGADFFRKVGEQANVPGRDINNKMVESVQRASSSLRPSQNVEQYQVSGTNVSFRA